MPFHRRLTTINASSVGRNVSPNVHVTGRLLQSSRWGYILSRAVEYGAARGFSPLVIFSNILEGALASFVARKITYVEMAVVVLFHLSFICQ